MVLSRRRKSDECPEFIFILQKSSHEDDILTKKDNKRTK